MPAMKDKATGSRTKAKIPVKKTVAKAKPAAKKAAPAASGSPWDELSTVPPNHVYIEACKS